MIAIRFLTVSFLVVAFGIAGPAVVASGGSPVATTTQEEIITLEPMDEVERQLAAWEYRPYQVLVWLVHDHSSRIAARGEALTQEVELLCRIADRSGWAVTVEHAPNPWNGRLRSADRLDRWVLRPAAVRPAPSATEDTAKPAPPVLDLVAEISQSREVPLDKLIIVQLAEESGLVNARIRELDVRTRIEGTTVEVTSDVQALAQGIYDGIARAFMPITRIEKISDDNVMTRVRAWGIAWIPEANESGELELVPNTGSPVWVRDSEVLMPVLMRKDRQNRISGITPVELTYLTIEGRDGPHLNCMTYSTMRYALGGRSGARTERVALCVRSPGRPTVLQLVSNEVTPEPLRDLDVFLVRKGEADDAPSEHFGKSDWRGQIVIPPNEAGFQRVLIRSGERPLAKVPVVPGLYDRVTATMPNDERRLYAEGIVKGYRNELLDLVARREILKALTNIAIDNGDLERAQQQLAKLRATEDATRFNTRLTAERKSLLAADPRQQGFIVQMFNELQTQANLHLSTDSVNELSTRIRDVQTGNTGDRQRTPAEDDSAGTPSEDAQPATPPEPAPETTPPADADASSNTP